MDGGTLLGKLPNPFLMENGSIVSSREEWNLRREEIKKLVLDIGYGGMPPEPDSTQGILLHEYGKPSVKTYLVTSLFNGRELSFELKLYAPSMENGKKYPVVLDGDGCWTGLSEKVIESFNRREIIAAQFNRCALVRDVPDINGVMNSPLYRFFPGISSGSVAGWAWGFIRCIDVLEKLPFVDSENIAITGHSRGGKAVLVAGIADERPAIVNSNASGAGGSGCWRYRMGNDKGDSGTRSETLADILKAYPAWMGSKMKEYQNDEAALPFDQHYLIALMAPRYFLETDAAHDIWLNPAGTYGTLLAAKEVYRFMQAEDHILWNYRDGGHAHTSEDFKVLEDVIDGKRNGKVLSDRFQKDYFPEMHNIFD